jgi:hypothetical protein
LVQPEIAVPIKPLLTQVEADQRIKEIVLEELKNFGTDFL